MGKTTIAEIVVARLADEGVAAEVIDGATLEAELGPAEPGAALRRVVWLAAVLQRHGVLPVIAVAAPDRAARDAAVAAIDGCVEVFVDGGADPADFDAPIAPVVRVPTLDRAPEASAAYLVSWWETAEESAAFRPE